MFDSSLHYEYNPFTTQEIADKWVRSVENEKGSFRDNMIYPRLRTWKHSAGIGRFIEVGCGQGICAQEIQLHESDRYIGIDPSEPLVRRAKRQYSRYNRHFVIGNAYDLPAGNRSADGVFSNMVWFHLKNLEGAAQELSRVLKEQGRFLIITANPEGYKAWENSMIQIEKFAGGMRGLITLPEVDNFETHFYLHTLEDIQDSLFANSLDVTLMETFGTDEKTGQNLFLAIYGRLRG